MAKYEFRGNTARLYPGHQHPEQDGVLQADPNEVVEFGNVSPPGDGLWYDVTSGEAYFTPVAIAEDAASAQGAAEDPED